MTVWFRRINNRSGRKAIDDAKMTEQMERAERVRAGKVRLARVQNGQCAYCGKPCSNRKLTVDHVWPLRLGGFDAIGNWLACCEPCNRAKGSRLPNPCELLLLWAINQRLGIPTHIKQEDFDEMSKTKKVNQIDLAEAGTNAAKWAEALAETLGNLGNDALDATPGGVLFGWCANMIEAGRSAGYSQGEKRELTSRLTELAIRPGQHGFDVSKIALSIASANSGQELANVIGHTLDDAFRNGAIYATQVNNYQKDGIDLVAADSVEFKTVDRKIWVNVDGKLTLRIAEVGRIVVDAYGEPGRSITRPEYPAVAIPSDAREDDKFEKSGEVGMPGEPVDPSGNV